MSDWNSGGIPGAFGVLSGLTFRRSLTASLWRVMRNSDCENALGAADRMIATSSSSVVTSSSTASPALSQLGYSRRALQLPAPAPACSHRGPSRLIQPEEGTKYSMVKTVISLPG